LFQTRSKLKDPATLEHQVRRMLDDPRAETLVSNFAGQWLHLRNVETVKPDPVIFPFDETLRVILPGHVLASINWNKLCEVYDDRYVNRITDSNRIIVCKLKKNTLGMTSVAYPIDEPHLPKWFTELPFDHEAMEETIIDNKIMNLCSVLGWDLTDTKIRAGEGLFSWS